MLLRADPDKSQLRHDRLNDSANKSTGSYKAPIRDPNWYNQMGICVQCFLRPMIIRLICDHKIFLSLSHGAVMW